MRYLILLFFLFVSNIIIAQNAKVISCYCDSDVDADGISGCFDKCPNTPPNASVDSHGCPMDTDGDGVVDHLDKQLITPTECQPSDENGVGKCEYSCTSSLETAVCNPYLGSTTIYFTTNSILLDNETKKLLEVYANKMKQVPNFKVVVCGYDNIYTTCKGQQLAWDHAFTVIEYMSATLGIDKERFIFQYGLSQNNNLLKIRDIKENEEGPCMVPPPFPGMSKIKRSK